MSGLASHKSPVLGTPPAGAIIAPLSALPHKQVTVRIPLCNYPHHTLTEKLLSIKIRITVFACYCANMASKPMFDQRMLDPIGVAYLSLD